MTPERARLVEAFRDVEAAYRRGRIAQLADVVEAACGLLAAGIDAPGVVAVAGDDRVPTAEFLDDLDRASHDLGCAPMTDREALVRAPRWLARELLDRTISADRAAAVAWDGEVVQLAPDHISPLAAASLEYPEYTTEPDLREAAQATVDAPIPEEFVVRG